jgi:hypothetical protein
MSIGNGETCRKNQEAIIGNELIFHVDLEVHHATFFFIGATKRILHKEVLQVS